VESGDGMKAEGEAPAIITTHAFVPESAWWSTCRQCGLAEAAHLTTTLRVATNGGERVDRAMREAGER
jgi:hypothetical protein